jgi:hypothetical protein
MTTTLRRAQACSVVGRAVECMRRVEPRGKDVTRRRQRGRAGRLRRINYGGHSLRPSTARLLLLIACLIHGYSESPIHITD